VIILELLLVDDDDDDDDDDVRNQFLLSSQLFELVVFAARK